MRTEAKVAEAQDKLELCQAELEQQNRIIQVQKEMLDQTEEACRQQKVYVSRNRTDHCVCPAKSVSLCV